jgi:hypothetical protein
VSDFSHHLNKPIGLIHEFRGFLLHFVTSAQAIMIRSEVVLARIQIVCPWVALIYSKH